MGHVCVRYTTKYPRYCFRSDEIRYKIYPVHVPKSRSNFFTNVSRVIIRGVSALTRTRMVLYTCTIRVRGWYM